MPTDFWIGIVFGTLIGMLIHMLWLRSTATAVVEKINECQNRDDEWWKRGERPLGSVRTTSMMGNLLEKFVRPCFTKN